MNAVIYARYSSDNQREESIEGQVRECTAFAERKGYMVLKIYADRALSGTRADNRPEFQQMILDSANGEFDVIIVWKIDRFSRDKYDSVIYKSKLNKNGVSVISATEPIDDSPEGRLMESIFEGFSEYYVKDLELKTSRGMTENAIKGKFNGGIVTFGYYIDKEKHFKKDPTTAPIVKEIFTRYADGESIRDIVDDFNGKGVTTNSGRKLTYQFINCLLKNRRYIGEYTFRDTINNDAIPPIITEELFEKCRRRMEANKHKAASFIPVEEKYLLTGKIFCGHCGKTMSGVSGRSKSAATYRYYQCIESKRKRCRKKPVQKDLIENAVLNSAMSIFKDKAFIEKICDYCYEIQSKESTLLPALRKRLRQNEKELDNVMKAVKAGLITKTTKATLEELEAEKEKLETEISLEKMHKPVISREKIKEWIMQFAEIKTNNQKHKQWIIDAFINSIYVYDDNFKIFFNYKDSQKTIYFAQLENVTKKTNTHANECSSLVVFGEASALISELFSASIISSFVGISTGSSLYVRLKTILSL